MPNSSLQRTCAGKPAAVLAGKRVLNTGQIRDFAGHDFDPGRGDIRPRREIILS